MKVISPKSQSDEGPRGQSNREATGPGHVLNGCNSDGPEASATRQTTYPHDRKGGGLVVQLPSNVACRPQSSVVRVTDFPPSHVTLAVFSMTQYMTLLLDFFKAWEPILRPVVSNNTVCWQYAQVHSL